MNSFQTKDVSEILSRKFSNKGRRLCLFWALLNLLMAGVCYEDMNQDGVISKLLTSWSPWLWYLELGAAMIFFVNFVYDTASYVYLWLPTPMEVPKQKLNLLGIGPLDEGFKIANEKKVSSAAASSPSLMPSVDASFFASTPQRIGPVSLSTSHIWASTPNSSQSPSSSNLMSMTASSWTYHAGDSIRNYNSSPLLSTELSTLNTEEVIADERSFQKFMRGVEDKELKLESSLMDTSSHLAVSGGNLGSFLSQSGNPDMLNSYTSAKLAYQISPRNPQSSALRTESSDSSLLSYQGEVMYAKFGVTIEQLFLWTENLRKWLSKTVLSRLVGEIDAANDALKWQGTPDVQIGEVALAVLRQRSKHSQIPTLCTILQYLEVTTNQEYLVQRLRELEKGGCVSEFRWNSGGPYKGKPWADHLPTDSAVIMHVFLTYLDTLSPLHVSFPEGKPVTNRHFCKTPDKPEDCLKDVIYVYQTSIHPPNYKLILGGEVIEITAGRNNMFYAILLFLHNIKTKEEGMLNLINLGPSGLNVLWILED